jgi:predicted metal-dependent HD superfamily phosphohydrolase
MNLTELLVQSGVVVEEAAQIAGEVENRYSEVDRYYHTLEHIVATLSVIESLQDKTQNLVALKLAAWFHDAIYDSKAKDNEEQSAAYMRKILGAAGVALALIEQTERLILATKTHQAANNDTDCQILLDADLSILGNPAEEYETYRHKIRLEYAWVPEEQYRTGRIQVLEKFLQRARLYYTHPMYERYEMQARVNLRKEIESLSGKL